MEEKWKNKGYSFFQNRACEYFPCHEGVDEESFNCLFCYCPLYCLGEKCGGNFRYSPNGNKDCTLCSIPHKRENYSYITGRFKDIAELVKKPPEETSESK